jgi:hypothetical protein
MTDIDMSPDIEYLRNQLADRLDEHPVRKWSPGFIKAVTALLDLYIGDQLNERPAPVLHIVGPRKAPRS